MHYPVNKYNRPPRKLNKISTKWYNDGMNRYKNLKRQKFQANNRCKSRNIYDIVEVLTAAYLKKHARGGRKPKLMLEEQLLMINSFSKKLHISLS